MALKRCISCQTTSSIPRLACPQCQGYDFVDATPERIGTVESWTKIPITDDRSRIILIVRLADSTQVFGEMVNHKTHPEIGDTVKRIASLWTPQGERLVFCSLDDPIF